MTTYDIHIERSQPYDGDGWSCWGHSDGSHTAFGATPGEAFDNWLAINLNTKGPRAEEYRLRDSANRARYGLD